MNYEEYSKIEEKFGADSDEATLAYRDLCITDLEPLTDTITIDEFGDAVITIKDRSDITTEELLGWIDWFREATGVTIRTKGKAIKISAY